MGREGIAARVVRSGLWLYLCTAMNNIFGFLYWLAITRIGGAAILGYTSAVLGLSSLAIGLTGLGISVGMRRFLGAHQGDREELRRFLWSSLAVLAAARIPAALALLAMFLAGVRLLRFSPPMLGVASLLVALSVGECFSSLLVSTFRTDVLALATLLGNLAKLGLGVALVELGYGWVGASAAYATASASMIVVGLLAASRMGVARPALSRSRALEVVRAGLASWVPGVVALLGQQLAVVAVFSARGAVETGEFYIALVISGFVSGIATSMTQLLLPALSSMSSGREEAAARVIRLGYVLVTPIAVAVAIYSSTILSLLGRSVAGAATLLPILLAASLASIAGASISSLYYSYGAYATVLYAGLLQSAPRVALYAALVPCAGSLGASVAYLAGSVSSLSYLAAKAARDGVASRELARGVAIAVAIPALAGVAIQLAHLPLAIGVAILGASYLAYARLGILTRSDAATLARALASERIVSEAYRRLKPLIDTLFAE